MFSHDYLALGFVSNDHLAVLPYIPVDSKVKMVSHKIVGGLPVVASGGGCARVRNADGTIGPIAGSTGLFHKGFQRLARVTGLPLAEVVKAAGYNQLRSLGITDRGEIVPGQIADLVLVDDGLNPVTTIVGGWVAWEKR